MANEILSSTTSTDQEKFLAARLIQRSALKLMAASVLDKLQQPEGTGKTAYFVRYSRMNVPLVPLTEATNPSNSTFSLEQVTVTLDQWGDVLTISDVAQLTTKHPLIQQAIELLSDNAQRVIDREIQIVWLAGTNVQYGDGSVTARTSITAAMKATDAAIHKAVVTLVDLGAPPRGGPAGGVILGNADSGSAPMGEGTKGLSTGGGGSINQGQAYVGIAGPQVMHDIQATSTSLGTWVAVAMYQNAKAIYNSEIGTWLNIRWVETNFIPKFTLLGATADAVVSGNAFGTNTPVVTAVDGPSGGALASSTTFFYKVTRKSLLRGFEEDISSPHSTASTATGNNEGFTFNFSGLTAGYVYNLYFDTEAGGGTGTDATLRLVSENIAVGTTVSVLAVPTTGAFPPASTPEAAGATVIHPIYIHGAESGNWVGLQNLQVMVSKDEATTHNPLLLQKTIGYKFLGKAVIRDQLRMLRVEVASTYS